MVAGWPNLHGFQLWKKTRIPRGNPRRHREKIQIPHRMVSFWLNPGHFAVRWQSLPPQHHATALNSNRILNTYVVHCTCTEARGPKQIYYQICLLPKLIYLVFAHFHFCLPFGLIRVASTAFPPSPHLSSKGRHCSPVPATTSALSARSRPPVSERTL